MTTLSDLIARLEAAKEGSRELDYEIWRLIAENPDDPVHHRRNSRTYSGLPYYTTSLDAALTLVPEGYGAISASINERGPHSMRIGHPYVFGNGTTSALALCIAALKAREAQR